jgi:hypothetical protein
MKPNRNTLALGALFLTLPLFAVAQSSPSAAVDPAAHSEAAQMVSANASLLHDLDAKKDHTGSEVRAKLDNTVHLPGGTELHSGTILIGHLVQDDMQTQGSSKLAFDFTQAQLKDGKTVPITATIVGVSPGSEGNIGFLVEPGEKWANGPLQIDQVGVLSGIDLHSRIGGENSGVLVSSKKSDVKLREGSNFQLAIGAGTTQNASS